MPNALRSFLSQPYPYRSGWGSHAVVIVAFSAFVAAFLMIFQPFGIGNFGLYYRTEIALSFGLVTFVALSLFFSITLIFPRWFTEERWTLGKEILSSAINFLLVGNANYLFVRYGWYSGYGMFDYFGMLFATITVGFFPFVILLLLMHMRRLNHNLKEATALNKRLHSDRPHWSDVVITLMGENEGERLSVLPADLLYLASDANYVDLYYLNEGKVSKYVMRSTLTALEEQLVQQGTFFRCHRAYVVNLDRVMRISGNAQGYRLHLSDVEADLPVSRNRNTAFKEALKQLDKR